MAVLTINPSVYLHRYVHSIVQLLEGKIVGTADKP